MGRWIVPYGGVSAVNWLAPVAMRHFHEFGTTRGQLGQIALVQRRNAAANPAAVFRTPLTMDDYLGARMISTPLCLLDCDVPVDGSTALVVSATDHASDAPHGAVHINAVGTALYGRPSWDQYGDMTSMAAQGAAAHLWSRTDLKPSDVDVAQLYDGFSILVLAWLEALGFCGRGEGGPFVEGGHRIALGGDLPLNTAGGQLSGGRLHGFGLLHEAVLQLRGRAPGRQVEDARVAVVANGGGPIAGAMLLTSERR
jgi:acetyl-CoA acetyltransferase